MRERKLGLVAAMALGIALLLCVYLWGSVEPARPEAGASQPVPTSNARAAHKQVAPALATTDRAAPARPDDGAASSVASASVTPSAPGESETEGKIRRRPASTSPGGAPELTYVPASEPAPHNMTGDGFQLAAGATNPDVVALAGTVRDYRSAMGENPVGNNAEITRALLGDNPRHAQFLPSDALQNKAGELLDRWGHPYYFHAISRTEMEVHSAGPDGVMWSADDQVFR